LILLRNRNFSKLKFAGLPLERKSADLHEMRQSGFNPKCKATGKGAYETIREIRAANSHRSLSFVKARVRSRIGRLKACRLTLLAKPSA
jgi:hypothetical protein